MKILCFKIYNGTLLSWIGSNLGGGWRIRIVRMIRQDRETLTVLYIMVERNHGKV